MLAALAIVIVLIADDPATAGVDPRDEFVGRRETDRSAGTMRFRDAIAISRDRSFLLVFVGWVAVYTTLYVVLVHFPAFVVDAGFTRRTGALALGTIGAASTVARIGIGYLADQTGRVRTFVVCSGVMGVTTVALPWARSPWAIGLFAIVFGAAYGGNGALLASLVADLFGTTNVNTLFGLMAASFAVSGLFSPWIAGTTYDALGTYLPAFLLSGVAALVGAALIGYAGHRKGALGADSGG